MNSFVIRVNIKLTTPIQTPSHPIVPHPQPTTVPVSKDGLERNSWTPTFNHESLCETAETEASLSVEHLNGSGYTYWLKKKCSLHWSYPNLTCVPFPTSNATFWKKLSQTALILLSSKDYTHASLYRLWYNTTTSTPFSSLGMYKIYII